MGGGAAGTDLRPDGNAIDRLAIGLRQAGPATGWIRPSLSTDAIVQIAPGARASARWHNTSAMLPKSVPVATASSISFCSADNSKLSLACMSCSFTCTLDTEAKANVYFLYTNADCAFSGQSPAEGSMVVNSCLHH
jgi:hypothetical protein